VIDDDGIETPPSEDGVREKPPARKLIGYFTANTDVDEIVDMIIATVPPDERPPEDRPNRMPKHV
jgi:hypothetical protein